MPKWTAERIAGLSFVDVRNLRQDSFLFQTSAVIALCDAELLRRAPVRNGAPRAEKPPERRRNNFVREYHFVCRNEGGVTKNDDGTCWSGSWVVDHKLVRQSLRLGAHVALHRTKAERSYLQGNINGWRVSQRNQRHIVGQTVIAEYGVEFLFEQTNDALQWVGDGTGEKAYFWQPMITL